MIDKIEIQNFKCFHEKHAFNLKNLNLFTGTNGKGKSSILQTFLLFRQSREMNVKSDRLLLNGNCVNLGFYKDVKNSFTGQSEKVSLTYDGIYLDKKFHVSYELEEIVGLNGTLSLNKNGDVDEEIFRDIHYISADRIGPKPYYDKNTPSDFINVGSRGEYTANVL